MKLEISDEGAPTIRNMVYALDGLTVDGVTLDTAVETLNEMMTANLNSRNYDVKGQAGLGFNPSGKR